ncbi:hypothetical protein STEPF1_05985 [Streptomyces sp. F-1]|nr:hypothetical protein STEPF1_05985 [Streptomyces sp. F-1]
MGTVTHGWRMKDRQVTTVLVYFLALASTFRAVWASAADVSLVGTVTFKPQVCPSPFASPLIW